MRRRPADLDDERQDALGLDAHVQVGRLTGDREVRIGKFLRDEHIGRAVIDILGLLVGHADEAHADAILRRDVVDGADHRRKCTLHVVGAAADQPIALDARSELVRERGDDVDVPVQHDQRTGLRPGIREDHRQAVVIQTAHRDVACLEPPGDELGGRPKLLRLRRVVAHQTFSEHAFVHHG